MVALPLFIGELAEDYNRGRLVTVMSIFITLGNIYGFLMSSFFEPRAFALICVVLLLVNIILLILFVPDSPIYLAVKRRKEEAIISLMKLRNTSEVEAEKMLSEIEYTIMNSPSYEKSSHVYQVFKIKNTLFISCGLFPIQHFSGAFAIIGYLQSILSSAHLPLSDNVCSIAVGLCELIPLVIGTVFIEKLGRKVLLMFSSGMVILSLFILGTYFHFSATKFYDMSPISWLPIVSIMIFIMGYGIGIGPTTYVLLSEIFPVELKSTASSISVFFVDPSILLYSSFSHWAEICLD